MKPKDETRETILKVAAQVFARKGFSEASMNDIVQASQISKGGIYWHFTSKDEMIRAIFVEFFEMQIAFLETVTARSGTAKARLLAIGESMGMMLVKGNDEPQVFPHPLDFYTYALRQPDLITLMKPHVDRYVKILAELIRTGIEAHEFRECQSEAAALVLLSAIDGLVLASSLFGMASNLAATLRLAMELFIQGLERK